MYLILLIFFFLQSPLEEKGIKNKQKLKDEKVYCEHDKLTTKHAGLFMYSALFHHVHTLNNETTH